MPHDKPARPAPTLDSAEPYQAPGPVDPFLEPLVWSAPATWGRLLERLRKGELHAENYREEAAAALGRLHADFAPVAGRAPFDPFTATDTANQLHTMWMNIVNDLGQSRQWLAGFGPEDVKVDSATNADYAVMLGQVMRAAQLSVIDKISELDKARIFTAQMRADWKPFAAVLPGAPLTPGYAVDRYNWLLGQAKAIVVKKSQHVHQLDEINLAELPRSASVLDFSLIHLVRALAFA